MKTIDLIRADNELYTKKPYHQYILILMWIVYGLFYLYKGNFSFDNTDTFLGAFTTIIFIIAFIYNFKMIAAYKTFQLVFNDKSIKYRYSIKNKAEIKLEELDHIELKVLEVFFVLISGEKKEFHLEDLNYKSVLQVKKEIKNFAESKKIQIK